MLQVVFILDQYKIGVEDVTEMMWDNEREMNPVPQPAPSPFHFSSKNPAWGAPATVRRLGTASPSRAGKSGTEPGSSRGCSASRSQSAGRNPRARDRDPNPRSRRGSSRGSSRGPRTAKDSESPSAGLVNPALREVSKSSRTRSKTDRGSHGEETPKASDRAELKAPETLFSRRRGHTVANPDEKNEADIKQVKENSELCEENGDGCHYLYPFSYVSNWPRPAAVNSDVPGAVAQANWPRPAAVNSDVPGAVAQANWPRPAAVNSDVPGAVAQANWPRPAAVNSDVPGAVNSDVPGAVAQANWPRPAAVNSDVPGAVAQAKQAEITPADKEVASLSVNANSTDADGKYSVRKTSEDILFAGTKDFFAQKFGEKPSTDNPTAVRPVASVTPQVKPKPDLGRHGTGGVPKASEDLLFGSQKEDRYVKEAGDEKKWPSKVEEDTKPHATPLGVSNSVRVPPEEATPSSSSERVPSSPVANNLQSIIANLISNVQKLHSQSPQVTGPEAHFVSYLSQLAQLDKLKTETKTAEDMDSSDDETLGNEDTKRSLEKLRYLSDGEITDSDDDGAVNGATANVAKQEKMLFEYNHLPAVNMTGNVTETPESSARTDEADLTAPSEILNAQMKGQVEEDTTTRPQTSNSEGRSHGLGSDGTKPCGGKAGKSASRRRHTSERKKSTGLGYEEGLEPINSLENDMSPSDFLSRDETGQPCSVVISADVMKGDDAEVMFESGAEVNGDLALTQSVRSSQAHPTHEAHYGDQGVHSSKGEDVHGLLFGRGSERGERAYESGRSLSPFKGLPDDNVSSSEMTTRPHRGRERSPDSRRGTQDPSRSPLGPRRSSPGQRRLAQHPGRSSPNPKTAPSQTGSQAEHTCDQRDQEMRTRPTEARPSPGVKRRAERGERVWDDGMWVLPRGNNRSGNRERRAQSLDRNPGNCASGEDRFPRGRSAGGDFRGSSAKSMGQVHDPPRRRFDAFSEHIMDDARRMRGRQLDHGDGTGSFRSREGSFHGSFRETERTRRLGSPSAGKFRIRGRSADRASRGNSLGFTERWLDGGVRSPWRPSPHRFDRQRRPGSSLNGEAFFDSKRELRDGRPAHDFEDSFTSKREGMGIGVSGSPFYEGPDRENAPFSKEDGAESCPHRSGRGGGDERPWKGRGSQGTQNQARRFPNYEAWRRAHGEISEDNLNSSLSEPAVILKYNSMLEQEDMAGRHTPNRGDFAEVDLRSRDRFPQERRDRDQFLERGPATRRSPFPDEELNRFEERHQHMVEERRSRFDDFPHFLRHEYPDRGVSGHSRSRSPRRLFPDESWDFPSSGRNRSPGSGPTGLREERRGSRFGRREGEGFGSVAADEEELFLTEHIHDLLDKAQQCGRRAPSPPHSFVGNSSDLPRDQPLPVELEIHEQEDHAFLRLDRSPGPPRRDFHHHKRKAEEGYLNHPGPSKKPRASPPREHYRRTSPRDHHRGGHEQSCRRPSTRRRSRSKEDKYRDDANARRSRESTRARRHSHGRGQSRDRSSVEPRHHREPRRHSSEERRDRRHHPPSDCIQEPSRHLIKTGPRVEVGDPSSHHADRHEGSRRRDVHGKLASRPELRIKLRSDRVQPPFESWSGYDANRFEVVGDSPTEEMGGEFDEPLPPYSDLDQPLHEDGDDMMLFQQHVDDVDYEDCGVAIGLFDQRLGDDGYRENGDDLEFGDSWGNGFGEAFAGPDFAGFGVAGTLGFEGSVSVGDIGDMTGTERERAHSLDLRNVLRNRVRSRTLRKAKAEQLRIRVKRGGVRRGAQKGKYLDENGREVIVAGRH